MKKKMPRAFNRKLKREYQKGYAQRSVEVRNNILSGYVSTLMLTQQVIDNVNAGVEVVTVSVLAKDILIDMLNMKEEIK